MIIWNLITNVWSLSHLNYDTIEIRFKMDEPNNYVEMILPHLIFYPFELWLWANDNSSDTKGQSLKEMSSDFDYFLCVYWTKQMKHRDGLYKYYLFLSAFDKT